ncbi:MerR family transcriptional regulator, partial [candidate division GN15 bacterium]|nr:MerR family transcriptional regulator [candidate division GN15 bacterium]
MSQKYPIKVAASRSGLTTHLIRIWERRYGAVNPSRTKTNRRLYSDDDIHRLVLLRQATAAGMSIGQIANQSNEELQEIIDANRGVLARGSVNGSTGGARMNAASADQHRARCLDAVLELDSSALENALLAASVELGQITLFEDVLTPLFEQIGQMWADGELKVSHEHMASAVVRSFLGGILSSTRAPQAGPSIVVTTPAGHSHEVGALMVAITAMAQGWRALYLGPDIPPEDVAGAA